MLLVIVKKILSTNLWFIFIIMVCSGMIWYLIVCYVIVFYVIILYGIVYYAMLCYVLTYDKDKGTLSHGELWCCLVQR